MKRKTTNNDIKLIEWINDLPKDFWDFKSNDTKELTHGFHSYPATMIYPISRNIIKKVKTLYNVNSLFDPFSGSGTVPVEGFLANIPNVYATDLNPLSVILTKVKTTPLSKDIYNEINNDLKEKIISSFNKVSILLDKLDEYIEDNNIDIYDKKGWADDTINFLKIFSTTNEISLNLISDIPNFNNIGYWFKPRVVIQIQLIKNLIENITDESLKNFYMISLSETIRLVSNKRNSEFKMYRMDKNKLKSFNPDVRKIFLEILDKNLNSMHSFYNYTKNFTSSVITSLDDARILNTIPNNSIDLVITSPPYGDSRTTVAYGEFSKLSLQWVGIDDDNKTNIDINKIDKELLGGKNYNNGFDFKLDSPTLKDALEKISQKDLKRAGSVYSFYFDLDTSLQKCSKKSKIDTYQFWVVGNRTVKETYLKTDEILVELAKKHNLQHVITFTRNIHNKVMPSLNSPSNKKGKKITTMTNEFIVVLRKI